MGGNALAVGGYTELGIMLSPGGDGSRIHGLVKSVAAGDDARMPGIRFIQHILHRVFHCLAAISPLALTSAPLLFPRSPRYIALPCSAASLLPPPGPQVFVEILNGVEFIVSYQDQFFDRLLPDHLLGKGGIQPGPSRSFGKALLRMLGNGRRNIEPPPVDAQIVPFF